MSVNCIISFIGKNINIFYILTVWLIVILFQRVEEFLDKGIHFALTSKTVLGTNHKGDLMFFNLISVNKLLQLCKIAMCIITKIEQFLDAFL